MQQRGYVPGAKVVLFEKRKVDSSPNVDLGLVPGDWAYYVHRLRLINQEPVLLERLVIPVERFPGFECFDLSKRSLYEVMETEYGVKVMQARQSLEPVVAGDYEAKLLEVSEGAPLMLERRVAFDQENRAVESGRDLYRGDRFRFVTEIAPLVLNDF